MSFLCNKSSTEDVYYRDIFSCKRRAEGYWKGAKSAEKLKPTRRCLALPSAFQSLPDSIKSTQRRGSAHMQALETGRGGGEGGGLWREKVEE